jgi:hypothetical protein
VARESVICKRAQRLVVVVCGGPLHRADTDVAGRDPRKHGAFEHGLAIHRFAGGHDRQTARGRNPERVHRFADDVLAQHGPERGSSIAAPRVARRPRPFELNVPALAGRCDLFAEQDGAPVPECGEVAELVARVRLCDGPRAFRQFVPREDPGAVRAIQ